MQLKAALAEIYGLRYMIDRLDIKSGLAHRVLLASPFIVSQKELQHQLELVSNTQKSLCDDSTKPLLGKVTIKLVQVRDIGGTAKSIQKGVTLNDIELFEVKSFALIAQEVKELLKTIPFLGEQLPSLLAVVELLDPEGTRIPSFYISSHFDANLAPLRKQLAGLELMLEGSTDEQLQCQSDEVRSKIEAIEDGVRQRLSTLLASHANDLARAILAIASIDILIAKAKQAIADSLVMPVIGGETTSYQGLFYPQLKEVLEQQNKRYQPIDVEVNRGACLITGANMAGKTVLLKTLALSQAMCQYGFFVPAQSAQVALVDHILFSIADEQSELSGLSSYGAEMLKVNHIVQMAKKQHKLLVLIDELARTTNPTEGRAIVNAVANFLNGCNVRAIITTHYSGLGAACRKLRVKGFIDSSGDTQITIRNIGDYIDYSLVEDDGTSVPHEALRIAQILGVDADILTEATKQLGAN